MVLKIFKELSHDKKLKLISFEDASDSKVSKLTENYIMKNESVIIDLVNNQCFPLSRCQKLRKLLAKMQITAFGTNLRRHVNL